MVSFNNPRKRDYRNSSAGFDGYIEKLNAQHPKKDTLNLGADYNYGMDASVNAMRKRQRDLLHKQLDDIKKEQKEGLRKIHEEQKRLRRGKPDSFI